MVGTVGLEPTTSASRTLRATKLRHVPMGVIVAPLGLVQPQRPDAGAIRPRG